MRPLRYLLDLPWWAGLLIFLVGNGFTPQFYAVGMPVALFGAWTFSKLMRYDDHGEIGFAIVGFPLFFLAMLIPACFDFETPVVDLLNHLSPTVTYALRGAFGMGVALLAFQGIRR